MVRKTADAFAGIWRIVDMEVWSQHAFDILGPAHFAIGGDGHGRFRFIAVEGDMNCRFGERDGEPFLEFTWSGYDDGETASGRGWAIAEGDSMSGQIIIQDGDDSAFTARRAVNLELKEVWL